MPTAAHTQGPSSAAGALHWRGPERSRPSSHQISPTFQEPGREPPNSSATASGPNRLIRPRDLCNVAEGTVVVGRERRTGGVRGEAGAPTPVTASRGGSVASPPSFPPLGPGSVSPSPDARIKGPVAAPPREAALSFLGRCEIGDDARRWARSSPLPPPSRATAHQADVATPLKAGVQGGSPFFFLCAYASNVGAWPQGRHRPACGGRGGSAVSSHQLVRLAREQGAPPTAQSADLRADVPTRDLSPATGSAIARRRRRGAPLPHRAAEQKGSAVRVTANRHQPNLNPPALEKKPRERAVCRFVGWDECKTCMPLSGRQAHWLDRGPLQRREPTYQERGPGLCSRHRARGDPARRSVQCCARRQGHADTLLTESWGWERRWPCRSCFCFGGAGNGRPFAVANCNLGGASVDLQARTAVVHVGAPSAGGPRA